MMQGDAYLIPFTVSVNDGTTTTALTPSDVSDIEMVIGSLKKTYADGEITYSDSKWHFPVTQAETFAEGAFSQPVQIRVKLTGGDVIGTQLSALEVQKSISKEVL